MEHANSPKIASPKDSGLPTPSGSGKTADSYLKVVTSGYRVHNNIPNTILAINSIADVAVPSGLAGNKSCFNIFIRF